MSEQEQNQPKAGEPAAALVMQVIRGSRLAVRVKLNGSEVVVLGPGQATQGLLTAGTKLEFETAELTEVTHRTETDLLLPESAKGDKPKLQLL